MKIEKIKGRRTQLGGLVGEEITGVEAKINEIIDHLNRTEVDNVFQKNKDILKSPLLDDDFLVRVGQLRQWLNEDRITDPDRMVTNEQILTWLSPLSSELLK